MDKKLKLFEAITSKKNLPIVQDTGQGLISSRTPSPIEWMAGKIAPYMGGGETRENYQKIDNFLGGTLGLSGINETFGGIDKIKKGDVRSGLMEAMTGIVPEVKGLNKIETILRPAVNYKGKIFEGVNHGDALANAIGGNAADEQEIWYLMDAVNPSDKIDGFVTSSGRFVDRKEAYEIANATNKVNGDYQKGRLSIENWSDGEQH